MLNKFFKLEEHKTTVKTEVVAGITTFMTMAYILAVNPDILSATGMDKGALFTATAISAAVGTLVMALWAKLPLHPPLSKPTHLPMNKIQWQRLYCAGLIG